MALAFLYRVRPGSSSVSGARPSLGQAPARATVRVLRLPGLLVF